MKLASVAVGVGLVAALAADARADCAHPRWVGTPTGATIPATGRLYVYDEGFAYRGEKTLGGPIVRQTRLSETVLQLDYVTKADELELADDYEPTILQVNPSWKAPTTAPRVIQYWHHKSEWACSHSDSLMLQIDQPTAAFRVYWQSGDLPLRELIVPARTAENNVSVLELGKIDCGSTLIAPAELAAGGTLLLVAIRYDGTEVAVAGLPQTISTARMPVSEDGLRRAIGYPAGMAPTASLPPADHDWPYHLFLLLLIPAAA
nr:hypothetical protein [Deltaproteobacteria bacterium]